jgi:uncharacterized protein YkwD
MHPMKSAVLLLACGCADLAVNKRSPGNIADGKFTPALPAAANYGVDPARQCPAYGTHGEVASQLKEQAGGKTAPEPDGRLCAAAETLLNWDPAETPSENVLSFLSWHLGLPSPVRRVVITNIESEDTRALAGPLVDGVMAFAATASMPRYGLSTKRVKKGTTKVVLLMQEGTLELDPLPRKLPLGGQATLSGRVMGPLDNPRVAIADVAGHLDTPKSSGKAFKAELKCGDKPGKIAVEIRAEEQGSETLPANFFVFCGEDPPASVALGQGQQEQPAALERKVFELINEERSAAGLKPLEWDDAVAGVARAVSESRRDAMKKGGSVSSDVVQRLKAVDVMSPLVLQNSAQARDARDAATRFMMSPAHRANYLSTEATHVGIGAAAMTDSAGKPSAVITELFVKELPPLDVAALREKLYAELARKRSDARAAPLRKDAMLEEMAQRYATELAAARGDLPKARDKELIAPLYKSYLTVNILGGAKNEPLEFAEEPGVLSNGKLIGVGVAQGVHPVLGKNAVFVVVFIGTKK